MSLSDFLVSSGTRSFETASVLFFESLFFLRRRDLLQIYVMTVGEVLHVMYVVGLETGRKDGGSG
jgi:hypothetical protein